jgi:hypothetical protein
LLFSFRARFLTFVFVFVQEKSKKYLILMAVIDTNYGKTTRIPNIPETGTLLKHGTDRKWKKIILKTAIKSFESRRFVLVGLLTANNLAPLPVLDHICFVKYYSIEHRWEKFKSSWKYPDGGKIKSISFRNIKIHEKYIR